SISELKLETSPSGTNMVQFSLTKPGSNCQNFLKRCQEKGLLLFPWLPSKIRAVVHRPISEKDILKAVQIIQDVLLETTLSKKLGKE
ncbi:MAG: hypothetical protein EBT45_08335, partial [Alphaproteobacteria bacterium]|nr:hypothetical protein [Alphaproteobacteria bacterium]